MKRLDKDKELISAYLDGELSLFEKKQIEEKIKGSLELQKALSDIKKLKELTNSSYERVSDSPYFETKLFANLNSKEKSAFNIRKWIPVSTFAVVAVALMLVLKFNPNLINDIIKQQKSNLEGFYKENLQPLLYAANLSNEDIFNFAVNQELPLDSSNTQLLKLGYDTAGAEYFEIKNANHIKEENNLRRFVTALDLDEKEQRMMDSIINSYSERISGMVLVNEKNAVAINPGIWNTRKLILADILAFAERHSPQKLYKLIPPETVKFDDENLTAFVNQSKDSKNDQFIFFTPDSVFKESFVFDMTEFKKNMRQVSKEIEKLKKEENFFVQYSLKVDSSLKNIERKSNWTNQFKVFIDTNIIKVRVENFAVDIPDIDLPDFDSIAIVLHEATKNLQRVYPPVPPVTVGSKDYKYDYNYVKPKRNKTRDLDLDSLMKINQKKSIQKSKKSNTEIKADSEKESIRSFYRDSLIILHNQELKREMDELKRELQKFRNEMKSPQNDEENAIKEIDDVTDSIEIIEI